MLPVELLGDRRDPLDGEVAHRSPEQLVLVGEVEVHGKERASSAISRTPYPVPPTTWR